DRVILVARRADLLARALLALPVGQHGDVLRVLLLVLRWLGDQIAAADVQPAQAFDGDLAIALLDRRGFAARVDQRAEPVVARQRRRTGRPRIDLKRRPGDTA